ncbi:MAG: SMC family ATPase [Epsilonproteobacteria bacterium]|nr:SMC family ATPase [Campylobacterota bacterium]
MILRYLSVSNFKKYKHKDFHFDDGLIGIVGNNGAGKSTIFEAILFALYGELKRGYKEYIKHAYASPKDNVSVVLEFELSNHYYKIVREFRGKALSPKAFIYQDDTLQACGVAEVNRYIVSILKITKTAFINTVFASQKELTSLSKLNKEERKKLIRKLLGFDKIDYVEVQIKETIKQLNQKLEFYNNEVLLPQETLQHKKSQIQEFSIQYDTLDKSIAALQTQLTQLTQEIHTLTQEIQHHYTQQEKLLHHQKEIALIQNNITNTQTTLTKLQTQLSSLYQKKATFKQLHHIKERYDSLKAQLTALAHQKELFTYKQSLLQKQQFLQQTSTTIQNKINHLNNILQPLPSYLASQKILSQQLTSLTAQQQQLQNQIAIQEQLIQSTQQKIDNIKSLGRQSPCPVCTRALLDEYDGVLASLQDEIYHTYQQAIDKLSIELTKITDEVASIQSQYDQVHNQIIILQSKQQDLQALKKEMLDIQTQQSNLAKELEELVVEYDAAYHQTTQEEFDNIQEKYNEYLILQSELNTIPNLENDFNNTKQDLQRLNATLESLMQIDISYDKQAHQQAQATLTAKQSQKESLQQKLSQAQTQQQAIKHNISILTQEIAKNLQALQTIQAIRAEIMDYTTLQTHLQTFKNSLNSRLSPRISAIASELFNQITKGKYQYIEVSDEFEFYIYDNNQKYPIDRFSGGEIDLANLVLRIAISKVLTELNGTNSISFLAFDEVFGSQDDSRREEIMQAFWTIQEHYRQIFVISHQTQIKDMFKKVISLES